MQMQKMGTSDGRGILPETSTETYAADRKAFSGPLNKRGTRKSARFNIPDDVGSRSGSTRSRNNEDYVEITLDVGDDSVAVRSVKTAGGGDVEDTELTLLAKGLEKRGSLGTSAVPNALSRIRQVSEELRKLTSFSRRPLGGPYDRTKSGAVPALQGLKFVSKANSAAAWAALENEFNKLTKKTNGLLPRASFGECIGMNKESKEFAGELFDALSRRQNIKGDLINKEQLKDFWDQISEQSFDTRLQTFFDMVDKDADGRISEEEVKEIISLSASANKLVNIQKQAAEYAALIMEELDPDNLGYIMIESLETLLLQDPAQSVRGDSKALSMMLSTNLRNENYRNPIERGYDSMKYFIQDNWQRIWVLAVWIGICAGLFSYKYIQYKNRAAYDVMGACVSIAKGGAETLKFNMALILLPVCRNTITWLRNKTKLGVVVPFDDNLNFHKVIAFGITIGVGLHAISHLACDFPRLLAATEEEYEPMEQYFGEQPTSYWWFVKGVEGWTGITMVVLMAIAFTLATPWLRRGRLSLPKPLKKLEERLKKLEEPLKKLEEALKKLTGFNAFWYTHHLFIIVYGMLIVHGIKLYLTKEWYKKTTWMYLAVPMLLYACERLTRALRSSVKPVIILKVAVYPENVLALHMSKPAGFKYKSGQYMFVNCKKVSPFEWHPFSITSAPGDDYLSVHIRTLGDWTRQLKTVFSEVCRKPTDGKSGLLRADNQGNNLDFPTVLIDGPYGAPAQDYKKYDVVLLVGLGIGATPMISILKDIVNNMKTQQEEEAALESGVNSSVPPPSPLSKKSTFKKTRAYFYWVTREQGSFDWFKGVMNEVTEIDHDNVIEMHIHCTSVYEEGDARSALITMLQSLNHAKNGVDVVSGTRVKSHFAKPDWRSVYKRIAVTHSGQRIGVFYCGAAGPVPELKQLAADFTHKTDTKFDFHKENF